MSYTAKGVIKEIKDTVEIGNFKKREFILDVTEGQYTNQVALQFTKDKVNVMDNYSIGQTVEVSFNISSREHKGSWYTSLNAWKIS